MPSAGHNANWNKSEIRETSTAWCRLHVECGNVKPMETGSRSVADHGWEMGEVGRCWSEGADCQKMIRFRDLRHTVETRVSSVVCLRVAVSAELWCTHRNNNKMYVRWRLCGLTVLWQTFHNIYVYQITTLHTLNLHNVMSIICQYSWGP